MIFYATNEARFRFKARKKTQREQLFEAGFETVREDQNRLSKGSQSK